MTTSQYALTGSTYAIRNEIREAGGRWDDASKTWTVGQAGLDRLNRVLGPLSVTGNKRDRERAIAWRDCELADVEVAS
jgi:hypothetical protein